MNILKVIFFCVCVAECNSGFIDINQISKPAMLKQKNRLKKNDFKIKNRNLRHLISNVCFRSHFLSGISCLVSLELLYRVISSVRLGKEYINKITVTHDDIDRLSFGFIKQGSDQQQSLTLDSTNLLFFIVDMLRILVYHYLAKCAVYAVNLATFSSYIFKLFTMLAPSDMPTLKSIESFLQKEEYFYSTHSEFDIRNATFRLYFNSFQIINSFCEILSKIACCLHSISHLIRLCSEVDGIKYPISVFLILGVVITYLVRPQEQISNKAPNAENEMAEIIKNIKLVQSSGQERAESHRIYEALLNTSHEMNNTQKVRTGLIFLLSFAVLIFISFFTIGCLLSCLSKTIAAQEEITFAKLKNIVINFIPQFDIVKSFTDHSILAIALTHGFLLQYYTINFLYIYFQLNKTWNTLDRSLQILEYSNRKNPNRKFTPKKGLKGGLKVEIVSPFMYSGPKLNDQWEYVDGCQ